MKFIYNDIRNIPASEVREYKTLKLKLKALQKVRNKTAANRANYEMRFMEESLMEQILTMSQTYPALKRI